jgi:hypothetical protein
MRMSPVTLARAAGIVAAMAMIGLFIVATREQPSSQRLSFAPAGGGFVPPTRMNPGTGGGDITDVIAGTGLTGGGSTGGVTLNVACGAGITCAADSIALDPSALFSTNNVIPKGNGTGLTSSTWTDDGTVTATSASSLRVSRGAAQQVEFQLRQSGQTVWSIYEAASSNNLRIWNDAAGGGDLLTLTPMTMTLSRDDGASHANRPILTITNSSVAGAFNHRADIQFNVANTAGVNQNHVIQAEGEAMYIGSPSSTIISSGVFQALGGAILGDADADTHTLRGTSTVQTTGADSSARLNFANDAKTWHLNVDGSLSDAFAVVETGVATWTRWDAGGGLSHAGNFNVGGGDTSAHTIFGDISQRNNVGTTINSGLGFEMWDTTAFAAGVGGAIDLLGKFNTGGSYQYGARIKAMKSNSIDGNDAFDLVFATHPNGGATAERLRIDSEGNAYGPTDNTYFAWDRSGSDSRIGFTKKSGFTGKLTYGSANSFAIAQSNAIGIAASNTFTDRLVIDSSGNTSIVGVTTIKTGTPTTPAAASANAVLILEVVDGNHNYQAFRGTGQMGLRFNNASGEGDGFLIYDGGARSLYYGSAGTVRQYIDSSGGVQIGDTANTGVASDVDVFTIGNAGTGQSTTGKALAKLTNTGSYTTAGGNVTYYGANIAVSATESAGGNTLTGVALRLSATNGDVPTGIHVDDGDTQIDDKVYVANEGVTVTNCGTGASVSGNEHAGVLTPGTGSPTSCQLNFTAAYRGSYPSCTAIVEGISAVLHISASGGSGITTGLAIFNSSVALAGDRKIHYHCFGRP